MAFLPRDRRPQVDREIRDLIRRMSRENPTWGAPRILSELLLPGHDVAESTVAKYMIRPSKPPWQNPYAERVIGLIRRDGLRRGGPSLFPGIAGAIAKTYG